MISRDSERGSLVVEVVALVPMMMAFVLLVVFGVRWTVVSSDTVRAAAIAARVASESRGGTAITNGVASATTIVSKSRWCKSPNIQVGRTVSSGDIRYSARVTCTIDAAGLSILRLGTTRVTGTSVHIVDRYRSDR